MTTTAWQVDPATEPRRRPEVPPGQPLAFGHPGQLILGRTTDTSWWSPRSGDPGYADQVLAGLQPPTGRDPSTAIAVGALSFRPDCPALLTEIERSGIEWAGAARLPEAAPVTLRSSVCRPSPAAYETAVATVVRRLADSAAGKVVLGRWLDLETVEPPDVLSVLGGLARTAPAGRLFAVPAPAVDQDDVSTYLVGASPELLVERQGRMVRAVPMAGSAARHHNPAVDRRRARQLLESAKDGTEHRYVVEAVADVLGRICDEVVVDGPRLHATDSVWHLATEVRGRSRASGRDLSALHLAQLLQPTPAVAGTPRSWALQVIRELEGPRGAASGAVGWVDAAGDGCFAVAIRMGLLSGCRLRLFAGAGIVASSVPAAELAETDAKLSTVLRGIGLAAGPATAGPPQQERRG